MILISIGLFATAACLGLTMVYLGIRYRRGSLALGLGHAGIACLGLVLLIVQIMREQVHYMLYNDAAILFVMTLAGGLVLLALREGRKPPPLVVVSIHALFAALAILVLVVGYLHR